MCRLGGGAAGPRHCKIFACCLHICVSFFNALSQKLFFALGKTYFSFSFAGCCLSSAFSPHESVMSQGYLLKELWRLLASRDPPLCLPCQAASDMQCLAILRRQNGNGPLCAGDLRAVGCDVVRTPELFICTFRNLLKQRSGILIRHGRQCSTHSICEASDALQGRPGANADMPLITCHTSVPDGATQRAAPAPLLPVTTTQPSLGGV